MKYSNTVEYIDAINRIVHRNLEIIQNAKKEERELTEEENEEMTKNEEEVDELKSEKEELEKSLEETPEDEKENENRNKNIEKDKMEKKNFSIVKEIRESMKTGKPIEFRAGEPNYSVTTNGEDVVATEIYDILEPLRANLVLTKAGAHYMSGLAGDVQVPIMSATNVAWAGEVAEATDGSGSFTNITLSPKRLTAKVPISLQMLAQTSQDIEGIIMNDLMKAVSDKIEATVLGYAAGSTTQPAGMFYDATLTDITTYGDLCNFEADVEENNVYGSMHYIITPKAKAYLRGLIKGTNNSTMTYLDGEVDGTPTDVTTNLVCEADNDKGVLYGDFSNLYIGTWGDVRIDVVQDSYTLSRGMIMLIVNFFVDAKVARNEAFAFGNIVEPEGD